MLTEETTKQATIEDPYKVLRVSKLADEEAIKAKYYVLVKMYSPEYYPDEFIQIRGAYDMLRDPAERAKADISLINPASPVAYEDYPTSDDQERSGHHQLSLFKLNQELQQILGERKPSEASPDEVSSVVHTLRGKVIYFCEKKRWDEAEETLRETIDLYPDDQDLVEDLRVVRWMQAFELARNEEWQEAGRKWFDLQQERGDDWRLTQNLALVAFRREDREHEDEWWHETLLQWNAHLKDHSDDEYVKGLIISLHHFTSGRLLDGSDEAGMQDLRMSGSGKALGMACMQRGNWPAAVEAFEAVLPTDEDDVDLLCQLGWAYLNINKISKAFQMWNRARKLAPEQEAVVDHLVRGNLTVARRLKEQRIMNQALVHFKNALRFAPVDEEIHFELATTLVEIKNYQAAAKACERIMEINPRHKGAKQLSRDARRLGNLR